MIHDKKQKCNTVTSVEDQITAALKSDGVRFRRTPSDTIEYKLARSEDWFEIKDLRMEAPKYELENKENHGMGYHAHIRMLKSGQYIRSGHLITIHDGVIFGVDHGRGGDPLFDLFKKKKSVVRELKWEFKDLVDYKTGKGWLPVSQGAIELYLF